MMSCDIKKEVQQLEYNIPWSNWIESRVWESKRATCHTIKKTKLPVKLWDYYVFIISLIRCHTAHDIPSLNIELPETIVTGNNVVHWNWMSFVGIIGCTPGIRQLHYLKRKTL